MKEVQATWKKKDSLTVSLKMFILWHICLKKQQQNTEDNQAEDMIPIEQDDSANYFVCSAVHSKTFNNNRRPRNKRFSSTTE